MRRSCDESGSALIWALLFVIITSALIVSHSTYMASRRGERDAMYNRATMADTFARSGLQDALGWFHRRSTQPITEFDPVYEPDAIPPRIETVDPSLGLVREFQISGNLFGRYEVRHDDVQDISSQRGDLVPGSIWEVGVRAYVFRKRDETKAFDQAPNQLVGMKSVGSEIRWLQINPPVPAAVSVDDPASLEIGPGGEVEGGDSIAISFPDPSVTGTEGSPTIDSTATVHGKPSLLPMPVYDATTGRVFAMRIDELRAYSDFVLDAHLVRETKTSTGETTAVSSWTGMWWDWQEKQGDDSLKWDSFDWSEAIATWESWVESQDWSFGGSWSKKKKGDSTSWGSGPTETEPTETAPTETEPETAVPEPTPIVGQMVVTDDLTLEGPMAMVDTLLIVGGDLVTTEGQNTKIDGIVYVTGDALLDKGKFELNGALIVRGRTKLGTGTGSAVVRYDAGVIERVRGTVGKYRKRRTGAPDGR